MEKRRSKTEKADAARLRAVEQIARQHLHVETLERRHRDALDFHEVPVWAIEAALIAAYDAGRASVRGCE
jgi:hypothetical protein